MSDYNDMQTNIDVEKIKKRVNEIVTSYGEQMNLFKRYREAYFMDNTETPKNTGVDKNDWKITASPSARNEVTGMKRLMDTGEIHITIKSNGETTHNSDALERGLKTILRVSGEMKRARVEKDANLSAVLWGPVALRAEALNDLILVQKHPAYRRRLEAIRKRSPFLISAINAEDSFPDWGKYGLLAHVEKYTVKGSELKETWGVTNCKDNTDYTVFDYIDLENRVVWSDQMSRKTIYQGKHQMPDMNVAVRYAGGSSLFFKPEEQLQSFLFAKVKGDWDKRENLLWTYIFTAIYQQGLPGPTLLIDGVDVSNPRVEIDYASGVKKIVVQGAKAQFQNQNVIDGDVMQIKAMMDDVSEGSTIRESTLGENIKGATFSALAMLSSAGKLPMIDPQEAVEQVFTDIFLHILTRIKQEGIDNEIIKPADIPEDVEVEVTMEAKLPQDNLRNAQVASALGDKVSDEWIHTNLLQIGDSKAMFKEIAKQNLLKAMIAKIAQDPQLIGQFISVAMNTGQPQQPTPQGPPQGPPQQPPGPPEQMTQGQMPPDQAAMMSQGGVESQPQTGPMIPPQERQ